ncbi:hypothetical protein [Amycolatopsis vastitatis]|uniref:linalool dehydratase/isomerase domain-containing protein n=1 Tax=Amycolatopsis vastitatis TaxID=1905142 RepID=UPI0034DF35C9
MVPDAGQGNEPGRLRRLPIPTGLHGLCARADASARLPAAPGLFQPVMQRLVEKKILLPEIWMYWRDVSRGGSVFNAHFPRARSSRPGPPRPGKGGVWSAGGGGWVAPPSSERGGVGR